MEQVREERFIMMKTHNLEWEKVFAKVGPKSMFVLIFLVARGFVEFSTGIINFTTWQRDQIRKGGWIWMIGRCGSGCGSWWVVGFW